MRTPRHRKIDPLRLDVPPPHPLSKNKRNTEIQGERDNRVVENQGERGYH